jgi:hypothetical protein
MPKVDALEIIKYIAQGMSEDLTHKKALAGVGKWNDLIETKKKKDKKKNTPNRFSLSPDRAKDIKEKTMQTHKAIYQ